MHDYTVTHPIDGTEKTLSLQIPVQEAIQARHVENIPFYNVDKEKDTVASRLGIDYTKQESLRRSPEFADDVALYIANDPILKDDADTRKKLGVMDAERKRRGSNGGSGGITKAQQTEIGGQFLDIVKHRTEGMDEEGARHLTHEYVTNLLNNHVEITGELEPLPLKPVKTAKPSEKEAELEEQVRLLTQQLADLGVKDTDDE